MASRTAAISVNVIADAARFKAGLAEADRAAGSFQAQMGSLAKGVAGALGTKAVIDFGRAAVGAAMDDAEAQKILEQTLRNTTGATDAQIQSVEDFITKTQRATGVLDDELRPAFGNLVRATDDAREAQDLLSLALDISTGTGKSVETISMALAKAYDGNTTALGKLGIETKDASGKALEFDEIQRQLNETFGGQTAAAAETAAGQMRIAQATFEDFKEQVGEQLIPVLGNAVGAVTPLMNLFGALPDTMKGVITTVGLSTALTKSFSGSLQGLGVSATTAKTSMGILNGVLIAYSLYQQDAAQDAQKAAEALANLSRATDDQLLLELQRYATARVMNDESMNMRDILADIARESYGTAERLVELGIAQENMAISTEDANAILADEAGAQRQVAEDGSRLNQVLDEGTDINEEAAAAAKEHVRQINKLQVAAYELAWQWGLMLGQISNERALQDAVDALDTVQQTAVDAFGGSAEAAAEFDENQRRAYETTAAVIEQLGNVPQQKQVQILAMIDAGQYEKVKAELERLTIARNAPVSPFMLTSAAFAPKTKPTTSTNRIPGLAGGGTITTAGMTLVGEQGPELLNLPRGAQVMPLSGTTGNTTVNVSVNSANPDEVVAALQKWIRQNGALAVTTNSAVRF